MLAKLIAHLTCLVSSVALSILVLMFGWGLEIQSWSWILWGCFFQIIILTVNTILARED